MSRGLPTGSSDEIRKSIRTPLKLKKEGKLMKTSYKGIFKTDVEAVNKSIVELEKLVRDFDEDTRSKGFLRSMALLSHALRRTENSSPGSDEEEVVTRNSLMLQLYGIRAKFEKKNRSFNKTGRESSLAILTSTPERAGSSSDSESSSEVEEVWELATDRSNSMKSTPVMKWISSFRVKEICQLMRFCNGLRK